MRQFGFELSRFFRILRLMLLRPRCSAWLGLLLGIQPAWGAQPSSSTPAVPPAVTTRTDTAGKLVNGWFADSTAAGNRGDRYDNRDGGHSRLNLALFPQLQPVAYTPEEIAQRRNQGPAATVLPFPTLGNASLAAPATAGGSLPRIIYHTPQGLRLLQTSYLSNNLYVYPEHQDHDPDFGDLYPLNTPYLVISKGSSYSDQPFLEALALTQAAFQPPVKEELLRSRLLVPTLQYILRSCLKPVQSRDDYLSGRAHPAVLPPEWLDPERMVRMAHQMVRASIPPIVELQTVAESPPSRPGIDYFEPPNLSTEVLANEISVIGRAYRSTTPERVLRVSASHSADLLSRPLRVIWRLLRGDPALVSIRTTPSGSEAEIHLRYHPAPLPVPGQPDVRSTRIDIGAFADNGISLSAPAFVSIYQIPSEERVFDEHGRLVQIEYQAPSRHWPLPPANSFRWTTLLERLWNPRSDWSGHFLAAVVNDDERAILRSYAGRLEPLVAEHRKLESQLNSQQEALARQRSLLQTIESEAKGDPALLAQAERQKQDLQLLEKAAQLVAANVRNGTAALERDWEAILRSRLADNRLLVDLLGDILNRLIDAPEIYPGNHALLEERAKSSPKPDAVARLQQIRQRLLDRRILLANRDTPDQVVSFNPLSKPDNRLYLRALNRTIVAFVLLPEVIDYPYADELADPRLTIAKPWRDVFVYEGETGKLRGWQRIQKGEIAQYDSEGRLLAPGGPLPVSYQVEPTSKLLQVVPPAPGS